MNLESVRQFCLTLPHSTEMVQWEDHLLLKVGGKMFVILALEPGGPVMSLKTSPDRYYELLEIDGIRPASHNLWKYHWISCERYDVLRDDEMRELLQGSYDLVYAGLSKKLRAEFEADASMSVARLTRTASPKKLKAELEGGTKAGTKRASAPTSAVRSSQRPAARKAASSAKKKSHRKSIQED